MKKIIFLILLFSSAVVFSQVTNEGQPLSWKLLKDTKTIQNHELPNFDLEALRIEDEVNDLLFDAPWRFGYKHMVDFGFEDGKWTTLENGDRIWRIKFTSSQAISMNVYFDEFFMPKGGKVYLYNDDRSDLLGAYTESQNLATGDLGTWLVNGETLWIDYLEPAEVAGEGKLHIAYITHGYRGSSSMLNEKGLGSSGDCNHDVDCPIGDDWEELKELNKKSVGIMLTGGSGFCSGALINNTAEDGKPYFLTANHCYSDPAGWAFMFDWISPDPICATTEASTDYDSAMTISGATLRAKNAASDFCLVEMSVAPEADWNRTYAGWDKTDNFPEFEVGIHHPAGDIMKVCRDDTGAIHVDAGGEPVWQITTAGGGWELGVTEGGSSGSPLFDQDGKIIGQLWRGAAACDGTVDNGTFDEYGRFAASWGTAEMADDVKLEPWLDPLDLNPDTLDSYSGSGVGTAALDAAVTVLLDDVDCGDDEGMPYINLINNGTDVLTSATITWDINGGTATTIDWEGTIESGAFELVSLGIVTFDSGVNILTVTVSEPNGAEDENHTNDTHEASYTLNSYASSQIYLYLLTDGYPEETTWSLTNNDSGEILYSGAPTEQFTEYNVAFTLPADICYTFEIKDLVGDGICCGYPAEGMYRLTSTDESVLVEGGEFTFNEITEFAILPNTSIDEYLNRNISIYPNPTNDLLHIDVQNTTDTFKYTMTNTIGQVINNGNMNTNATTLSLSSLNDGVYFIRITSNATGKYAVKKVIVSK